MSNCRLVSKTLLIEATSILCSSIFVEVETSSEHLSNSVDLHVSNNDSENGKFKLKILKF
uniref:Candidate secreted effector n=1 Tax=Meloidogyne incognita TaxID=6306 RepID=A0A914NJS5_MELIC